ncbi:MAG: hypothetical protein V4519_05375 [Patescibacteria group bacterium]
MSEIYDPAIDNRMERMKIYKERLSSIIGRQLNVENINEFADDILKDLINFTEEVVHEYSKTLNEIPLTKKELEDKAFAEYELTNVPELLDASQKKAEQLQNIELYIQKHTAHVDDVITPPDTTGNTIIPGDTKYEPRKILPRVKTLLYILENDLNVDLGTISLVEGNVTHDMVRNQSYITIAIPDLNRCVNVCDEEGNASYIFDISEIENENLTIHDIDRMTKEEKNSLIREHPLIGRRLIQTSLWRTHIIELLTESFEVENTQPLTRAENLEQNGAHENAVRVSYSELDPWRGFYTDPDTGKHWGPLRQLYFKVGYPVRDLKSVVEEAQTPTRFLITQSGLTEGYSYEDVLSIPKIKEHVDLPKGEKEGPWKGFALIDGKYYGSVSVIARQVGVTVGVIAQAINSSQIESKPMIAPNNNRRDAYPYEDVIHSTYLQNYLLEDVPTIEKEGEWEGFAIKEGIHYGSVASISKKIGISKDAVTRHFIQNKNIPKIKVVRETGDSIIAYSYETIAADPNIPLFTSIPQVETTESSEWRGFMEDDHGVHWAPIRTIAGKIGISHHNLRNLEGFDSIETKKIKDLSGREAVAYPYEVVDSLRSVQELRATPRVENTGEWVDFYTGPNGDHYAVPAVLHKKHKILSENYIRRFVSRANIESQVIIDSLGRRLIGYSYEKMLQHPEFKEMNDAIPAETSGEWEGFAHKDNDYYGALNLIFKKLNISNTRQNRYKVTSSLTPINIRSVNAQLLKGYSITHVERALL